MLTTRWMVLTALLALAGCGESSGTSGSKPNAAGSGGDKIICYSRENNSGTYVYFKEHVLKEKNFAPDAQYLPGTAAIINAVSKDAHSIGYGGIGYAKGVKILP